MGRKGKPKQHQSTSTTNHKRIGSCKKFQPQTLTTRLEKRKDAQQHKRQDGFEQMRSLNDLVESVNERQAAFAQQSASDDTAQQSGHVQVKESVHRSFYKEFRKVVQQADVVLEVLDARDPEGCRCRDAETAVLADYSKRLILVLNKIDLVPPDVAQAWHKHLSTLFPTVLFKANTQSQKSHLKQSTVEMKEASFKMLGTRSCIGAKELMKILGNYTRNKGIRTSIRVGVIGLPNVGKSSLINSLLRNRSCCVGATPGVTRCVQEVELDKNIKLLDSPGVVLSNNVGPLATIQNAVKLDSLEDPIRPIELVMEYCGIDKLAAHYEIDRPANAQELTALLAFRFGKLLSGGGPDMNAAARVLLKDWSNGSVQFYTSPPKGKENVSKSSELVSTWAKEFDLEDLTAVRVDDGKDVENMTQNTAPELSVVFKTDKPRTEQVDKLFDKPYEVPQLQNAKLVKKRKKGVKRDRKKMDKFSDMFDNAMNSMMDCVSSDTDEEEM